MLERERIRDFNRGREAVGESKAVEERKLGEEGKEKKIKRLKIIF